MSESAIVLAGAGGHARACIDVIEQSGNFSVIALVGTSDQVDSHVLGYPVVGTDTDLGTLRSQFTNALVAVGMIKTPDPRIGLFATLQRHGYSLPVIVSPRAHVSRHATLGAGTIVMHGAVVNAGAVVGCNCIINSQSLVEHDVVIGDHCHVATAAAVNSGVRVDRASFIGSNSSVRQGIHIGAGCIIGMGQRVVADCPAGTQLPSKPDRP